MSPDADPNAPLTDPADPLDPTTVPQPTDPAPIPDPDPAPTPTPTPTAAPTIGDAISAKKAAEQAEQVKKAEAAAANQAFADAQAENQRTALELKQNLGLIGATYIQAEDGSIEVYIPDGSDAGFHVIRPVAGSTPLPTPS